MKNKRRLFLILTSAILCLVVFVQAENLFGMVDNTSSLNIRSGPGYEHQIIGRLSRNVWVDILNDYSDWYYITDRNQHITGYVKSDFIKKAHSSASSSGQFVIVNAGLYLNLREQPSYNAAVLATYKNGDNGQILHSSGTGWAQVFIDGLVGFFREEFIRPIASIHNSGTAYVYAANGGSVNLRTGPGYQYSTNVSFRPGTKVNVHLKGKGFWYITVNGHTGFMDSKFLSTSQGNTSGNLPMGQRYAIVTNTGKRLNLREEPNISSRSIGQYSGGTKVYIESQGAEWSKVKVLSNGERGYMMSRYLTLYGMPGANVKKVSHPQKTFVFLRSAPYQGASTVITRVPHGSSVSVVAPSGNWTKVMYGNTVGYMMSYFLK
ncbi:MAG: SH3 domain-containing protein [Eubacteriales bacterium]|nr:SH3 domain-containing protein [Eubacteriales bacterium]